ncbi:response regulator [Acidithiobacillus sp. CV18-2]|nr:response regulator [Acidithiobacillus sp. CV18-3]MBU2757709.1 response regulator [Acidithiobacillus sp. BN09-2]MBU2778327.1 response regulator [Acidithiobacillus sp. CV18-2]MBU2799971.1 response regulator [Acidithiobacillus sp. VAN18-4]UTV80191.1 response regulator [Acidithiobacillus sp. YTS05]
MRILLVEDDRMLAEALLLALRDGGHAVDWVSSGQAARSTLPHSEHEVLLLDLGLPDDDGIQLLHDLRAEGHTLPILILSARDALEERLRGLDAGADDYLIKPFSARELLARLRAVQRRQGGQAGPLLSNGVLSLDPSTREAWREGGPAQRLSAREFALLSALLQRPGRILSREELETRIYGWGEEVESNSIDFLIHSVRKKLGADSIKNLRGAGWLVEKDG